MIHTILVPLDGSEPGEHALPIASDLARALDAHIVLVCVAGPNSALGRDLTDEDRRVVAEQYAGVEEEQHRLSTDPRMVEHMQGQVRAVAEAERYLAAIAGRLGEQGLAAEIAVPYGADADGILTEIELRSADLVVMAAHAHGGLARLIGGSTTQKVLERSAVPVVVVPASCR